MTEHGKHVKDSLRKRYFYKLSTNFFVFVTSFVSSALVPRSLGPGPYGDFGFLTNFFTQLFGFFDMGSSIGLYTKITQRPKELKLLTFYAYCMVSVLVLVVIFVAASQGLGFYRRLWPHQELLYIYFALLFAFLNWVYLMMNKITDAYGLTVRAEIAKISQRSLGILILIFLFISHKLSIRNYFYYNYIIFAFGIVAFYIILSKHHGDFASHLKITLYDARQYLYEFYSYSHPLFLLSLVAVCIAIFDRWFLQVFGGSIQQGFFTLSFQIGAVCFLFTSAMSPLIMREFSLAYGNKDILKMRELFRRHIPLLYSITAFLACFIVANAHKVTLLFGGGKFVDASVPVSIMALYPIHQTYGQLSGSVFYATGDTKLYRNIGLLSVPIGFPLLYLLIAPKSIFGMGLGAVGLAIKTVLLQFIAVNIQLFYNTRFLKISFWKYFSHQILCVASLLAIAIVAKFVVDKIILQENRVIKSFILSGMVYSALAFALLNFQPLIFGLKKDTLESIKGSLFKNIRKLF